MAHDTTSSSGFADPVPAPRGMRRAILKYGLIAGLVMSAALFGTWAIYQDQIPHGAVGMAIGYASMLVALSAVFMGIKHHRDVDRGGVIRFWPAFAMGLAISLIASVCYVLAWEAVQAAMGMDFATSYGNAIIAEQKAKGLDAASLARLAADMEAFKLQYANPLFRLPMTFVEIFPVGLLVSLVSAALLRNARFLPARA